MGNINCSVTTPLCINLPLEVIGQWKTIHQGASGRDVVSAWFVTFLLVSSSFLNVVVCLVSYIPNTDRVEDLLLFFEEHFPV